jgi:hypothetical protein
MLMANLRGKWPTNNLIGNSYLEMIVALDTYNFLVAHLFAANTGRNMNLLLSFTPWTFHRHHNVTFVSHCWVSVRILLPASVPLLSCRDETKSHFFLRFSDAELDLHAHSQLMLEHIKL